MNRQSIIEKFAALTIGSTKDGQRAPHKPLLVLYAIGKLLQGGERLTPYPEVDARLRELLREFGTPGSDRTQYPYWRMRKDELWEVTNADGIVENASGDVSKRDLAPTSGGFTREIADEIRKDPELVQQIVRDLLNAHFPLSYYDDLVLAVGIEFDSPIDSPEATQRYRRWDDFRENVLRAYEYRCAVCGFDMRIGNSAVGLNAAHIRWRQAEGPDKEDNGLALCTLHHQLFDRGAFKLSDRFDILVSERVHGSGSQEWLGRFHRAKINSPQRQSYFPAKEHIKWHAEQVFKAPARE